MLESPCFDVLVQWDGGDEMNVVHTSDLELVDGGSSWRKGKAVKMWWMETQSWFSGTIVDTEFVSDQEDDLDDIPLARLSAVDKMSVDDMDDLPLARINDINKTPDDNLDDIPLAQLGKELSSDPNYSLTQLTPVPFDCFQPFIETVNSETHPENIASDLKIIGNVDTNQPQPAVCEVNGCMIEIFAACVKENCSRLLCYDHFTGDCTICSPNAKNPPTAPEDYAVEGSPRERVDVEESPCHENRRKVVKKCRNRGMPYYTEKSNHKNPAKATKSRCSNEKYCQMKGFQCSDVSEERREEILFRYYSMADLQDQRQWIKRHVTRKSPTTARTNNSRKCWTIHYSLPTTDGQHIQVCRQMFLNTLDITDKQVRTVLKKIDDVGVMAGEARGGRVASLKKRDDNVRRRMQHHINRFPRMESHYCRNNSAYEYLSPDLTLMKMFDMYTKESEANQGSYPLYCRVFNSMKLKFHVPKKDMCGLCASYRQAERDGKADNPLREAFNTHASEKTKVREIKNMFKCDPDPSVTLACFDLEQVLYLPKSNRCEIFYKRRLACYNFTVYNVKSKECHCFVWHEGIASRGANEIASNLYSYLQLIDNRQKSKVYLFCDSCSGQNRNTIIPAMFLSFINQSNSISEITLHFFEPHHGQNEGDSVHSCVERAMDRVPEIMLPSQLVTIIELSRHRRNHVIQLQTSDISDWKKLSIDIGVLRCRSATNGVQVDWTKVKQIHVTKRSALQIGFKMSHHDDQWSWLDLDQRRQPTPISVREKAYHCSSRLSEAKYRDILEMVSGDMPVILHPEHKSFYKNLPH